MWEVRVCIRTGEGSVDLLVRTEDSEAMARFSAESMGNNIHNGNSLRMGDVYHCAHAVMYFYVRQVK